MNVAIVFVREYWKQLLALILVLSSLAFMSVSLYTWGYNSCKKDWDLAIIERNRVQEAQTKQIEVLTKEIADSKVALNTKSEEHLELILKTVQNKPLYKVVNGKCTVSSEFEKAYIDIVTYDGELK